MPTKDTTVKFRYGTATAYSTLGTKDENTLYFLSDTQELYKGDKLYSGTNVIMGAIPEAGPASVKTLYISANGNVVKYWNGTKFVEVKPALITDVGANANSTLAPTTKAVKDYVDTKVAGVDQSQVILNLQQADAGFDARLDIIEGEKGQVGSIKKALEDAKTYANGLAGNYATSEQGKLADTALQKTDISEGTVQGAISVDGTAVNVHGLGSAAYTSSGDYATSAQGTKANNAAIALNGLSGDKAVQKAITAAQQAAEGKVTALADGQVKTNTGAIAGHTAKFVGLTHDTVQLAINAAVADAAHLKRVILGDAEDLPTKGAENTIYLKKEVTGKTEAGNIYTEYMYINNAWEKIGDTRVDLTPYAKTTEVDKKIKDLALGTASKKDVGFFATSAQGAKADTAATQLTGMGTGSGSVKAAIEAAEKAANQHTNNQAKNYATATQGKTADDTAKTIATYGDIVTHQHAEYATAAQGTAATTAKNALGSLTAVNAVETELGKKATAEELQGVKTTAEDAQTRVAAVEKKTTGDIGTHNASEFATKAQGALAATALQKADITEGSTNLAINVDGTAIKVHGLGDAATKAANYYATPSDVDTKITTALTWNSI